MTNSTMAARIERLRTVPGLGRDTTALVVMILCGVLAAAGIKGYLGGAAPWSQRTTVTAEFTNVPGLNPKSQNSVTIAGVKVGTVTAAKATSQGTALITMTLNGSYAVYQNARAVLEPENPLDQMQVELNPGTSAAPRLQPGQPIPIAQTQTPVQADDIFDHLDERSQAAITDLLTQAGIALANAPTDIPQGLDQTSATLDTLTPVMTELATRRDRIAQLVTALSSISSAVGDNNARISELASSTQQALAVLASNSSALGTALDRLPGLTSELRKAMSGTSSLTTQLNPTLDDLNAASSSLPPALDRFKSTVTALGQTVDAAKPVVHKALPVIADLRPTVSNLDTALGSLQGVTRELDSDTSTVMSYLTNIKAFVYNTSSVFGAGDANGSIIRGYLVVPLPGAGVLPNAADQGQGGN